LRRGKAASMPKFPITGDTLYDLVIAVLVLIAGVGIAIKGERNWGWLVVALAGAWAFMVFKAKGFI
jgi:hypothetical protein